MTQRHQDKHPRVKKPRPGQAPAKQWDEVDEASWESFPASDSPSWSIPSEHRESAHPQPPEESDPDQSHA